MRARNIETKEDALRVEWDDGEADEFHYIWLRDHGAVAPERHPETGERIADFHAIPLDVRPTKIRIDAAGDLLVAWPDSDIETCYEAGWLRANAYSPERLAERAARPRLWGAEMIERMPRFDYDEVMQSEMTLLAVLRSLLDVGFALLKNAPTQPGEVERLAEHVGYLREICFGRLRDIRVEPQAYNLAFTSSVVKPHTDLSNYAWPPGAQFLHCLLQEAKGGDTRLVDGFAAAERLREEDPEAFNALTRVEVSFQIANSAYDVRAATPILAVGPLGELRLIRFSNQARRVLSSLPELVKPFYRGYHRLSELLNNPANQIHFRLAPGDILGMNNHRVLHARDAFNASTGRRHLQIGSMELDVVLSRIRMIERRINNTEGATIVAS